MSSPAARARVEVGPGPLVPSTQGAVLWGGTGGSQCGGRSRMSLEAAFPLKPGVWLWPGWQRGHPENCAQVVCGWVPWTGSHHLFCGLSTVGILDSVSCFLVR